MNSRLKALMLTAAVALGVATSANAATVSYTNAEDDPKFSLTIDDAASPGAFRFSLTTLVGGADYLGLGFMFGGTSLSQGDISLVSATNESDSPIFPDLELFGTNTGDQTDCGNGCNFSGGGSRSDFDYIIRIGEQGGNAENYVKSVVFDVAATGSLSQFSDFAVRAQVTTNPEGSIKTDLDPNNPAPIPLPAGLPLLGSGLLAIGILRRRRAAKLAA